MTDAERWQLLKTKGWQLGPARDPDDETVPPFWAVSRIEGLGDEDDFGNYGVSQPIGEGDTPEAALDDAVDYERMESAVCERCGCTWDKPCALLATSPGGEPRTCGWDEEQWRAGHAICTRCTGHS